MSFEKFIAYGVCIEPFQVFEAGKTYAIIGRYGKEYAVCTEKGNAVFVESRHFKGVKSEIEHIEIVLENIAPGESAKLFRDRLMRFTQELLIPIVEARRGEQKAKFEETIERFIEEISERLPDA